jgi:hypothetical protein
MAYVDTQLEFSDSQAVTSTAISTNVIDTSVMTGVGGTTLGTISAANSTHDLGQTNEPLYLVVQTAVLCTDTSSDATLTITLESDTAAALNSANVVHFSTGAMAFATYATAGTRVVTIALPQAAYKRYVGLRYTVASGPLTAGAFDAYLTTDPAGVRRTYASGFTVS